MTGFGNMSLAGRLICFFLGALLVSQVLTFFISQQEQSKKLDDAAKSEFFSRARTMTQLMGTVPPEYREEALVASETSNSRFWLTDEEPRDAPAWRLRATSEFSRPLRNFVDLVQVFSGTPATLRLPDPDDVATMNRNEDWRAPIQRLWALPQVVKYAYFDGSRGYGLVIRLDDGKWLNTAFYLQDAGGWWTSTSLTSLVVTALLLALIGVLISNRITRPLRDLASSAEALGRGENRPPLDEEGPEEIRSTAAAFNRMQGRLQRFIDDRSRMLAAIGHDLRTPLTTLRLRAEFVDEPETRQKMLAAVDELQETTEAAITLARGGSTDEVTRDMQLDALIGSICDDLSDLGQPVSFVEGERITQRCRPNSLRRAVRNLVDNAVRYGGKANVFIRQSATTVDIVVEDDGPGIPVEMREKVFAPFVRLETSRNRETGGAGLGLSITRAVARQHGGDVVFLDTATGMQAVISLPRDQADVRAPARKSSIWGFARRASRSGGGDRPDHAGASGARPAESN